MASIIRGMAKANTQVGPYGPDSSGNFNAQYGPSNSQLRKYPMSVRTGEQNFARVRDRYYGPGDYADAGRMIGTGLGGIAGGMVGSAVFPGGGTTAGIAAGGAVGMELGEGLGHMADTYFGKGDYVPSINQIAGGGDVISVNKTNRTGDIFIEQTEYIGNLIASVENSELGATKMSEFELRTLEINPSNDSLFPFLSQIAQNYEMYEWNGLMVKYTPNSGETSTASNQLGKIMVATNYDPECRDFVNSIEMLNYDYANSCKPSNTLVHGVETAINARAPRMLYVAEPHEAKDKVFTDIGKLYIATEGVPIQQSSATGNTSVVLGELHVTYSVRLSRAKLYGALLGYDIEADRVLRFGDVASTGTPLGSIGTSLTLDDVKAGKVSWTETSLAKYHPDASYWKYNSNTWGVFCTTDKASTPQYTFTFVHREKNVPMGCYRWKIVIDANSATTWGADGDKTNISGAVNVKAIKQTVRDGDGTATQDVLFIEGEDSDSTKPLIMIATGFIEISGNDPRPPQFTYKLNKCASDVPAKMLCKVTVEQVSGHVKDAVF